MRNGWIERLLLAAAGLCGAAGVVLAASASHSGGANTAIASNFLLFHAPALLGISLVRTRLSLWAGLVLLLGLVIFAGDLVLREKLGHAVVPFAAPIGGGGLILGWLLLAASALFGRETAGRR